MSLLASLSLDGLTSSLLVEGSVDSTLFLHYVEQFLVPTLVSGQIAVMGNGPIHAKDKITTLLEPIRRTRLREGAA